MFQFEECEPEDVDAIVLQVDNPYLRDRADGNRLHFTEPPGKSITGGRRATLSIWAAEKSPSFIRQAILKNLFHCSISATT